MPRGPRISNRVVSQPARSRINRHQQYIAIDFARSHPKIFDKRNAMYDKYWSQLTTKLNALGNRKTLAQWKTAMRRWRYSLRRRTRLCNGNISSMSPVSMSALRLFLDCARRPFVRKPWPGGVNPALRRRPPRRRIHYFQQLQLIMHLRNHGGVGNPRSPATKSAWERSTVLLNMNTPQRTWKQWRACCVRWINYVNKAQARGLPLPQLPLFARKYFHEERQRRLGIANEDPPQAEIPERELMDLIEIDFEDEDDEGLGGEIESDNDYLEE